MYPQVKVKLLRNVWMNVDMNEYKKYEFDILIVGAWNQLGVNRGSNTEIKF